MNNLVGCQITKLVTDFIYGNSSLLIIFLINIASIALFSYLDNRAYTLGFTKASMPISWHMLALNFNPFGSPKQGTDPGFEFKPIFGLFNVHFTVGEGKWMHYVLQACFDFTTKKDSSFAPIDDAIKVIIIGWWARINFKTDPLNSSTYSELLAAIKIPPFIHKFINLMPLDGRLVLGDTGMINFVFDQAASNLISAANITSFRKSLNKLRSWSERNGAVKNASDSILTKAHGFQIQTWSDDAQCRRITTTRPEFIISDSVLFWLLTGLHAKPSNYTSSFAFFSQIKGHFIMNDPQVTLFIHRNISAIAGASSPQPRPTSSSGGSNAKPTSTGKAKVPTYNKFGSDEASKLASLIQVRDDYDSKHGPGSWAKLAQNKSAAIKLRALTGAKKKFSLGN